MTMTMTSLKDADVSIDVMANDVGVIFLQKISNVRLYLGQLFEKPDRLNVTDGMFLYERDH